MPVRKRDYKTGGLRERSPNSWELKIRTVDPKTGRRVAKFFTFKGTKIAAKQKLRDLSLQAERGALPDDQKLFGALLDAWEAGLDVSPKTAERYKELARLHIRPHLGGLKVRMVSASRLDQFYNDMRAGLGPAGSKVKPLAPRTVGHVHRLVMQVLALAERDRIIEANPARHAKRPKVASEEIEILSEGQVKALLNGLRGKPVWLIAAFALATGLRRGELLALRWKDVDLEGGTIQVERALEETNDGLRFKEPKTRHGRRQLSIPTSIITELRAHRKSQVELRLASGLGRDADDALVFRRADGSPIPPDSLSSEWRRVITAAKLPRVSLHALRHTHASQLIAAGLDVLTISRRLGHGNPSITLNVYSHLFKPTDNVAATVFEKAFGAVLSENIREPAGTK